MAVTIAGPGSGPKRKAGRARKIAAVLAVLTMAVGLCTVAYPFVSDWLYNMRFRNTVQTYSRNVAEMDDGTAREMLDAARAFNEKLLARCRGEVRDLDDDLKAEYDQLLFDPGTEVMATIEIPKIGVSLPIYHGTSDAVLQSGVGHLEGSSLPVGGSGTHAVFTGHSGLPSKKLFTDLDKLEEGDIFTISVLGETLTYLIDGYEIVLPEDADLRITEGEDEATLITCTPVGVNTHRLLVHAHRAEGG